MLNITVRKFESNERQDAYEAVFTALAHPVRRRILITIARYSAAITSGLHHATGRRRGGIAGRWTKPVATPRVCAAASEARSLWRTQPGELYLASTGAASVA